MKTKIIVFLLASVLTINHYNAQSINDSIIKNVTLINNNAVVKNNNDYLIDVVLHYDLNDIPVILNGSRLLPNQLFFNDLFKTTPVLLITPNWQFYDAVTEEANRIGGCIEPAPSFIYYQRQYFNNISEVDSIKVTDNYPKLVFNSTIKDLKDNDNIVFYHTESYGSTCCPLDPKWKEKDKFDEFITSFETKNNIKLGDVYKKITGKEGEQILYFTLSNLNIKQKLHFLQEVSFIYLKKKNRQHIEPTVHIYTAFSIRKEGLKLMSE